MQLFLYLPALHVLLQCMHHYLRIPRWDTLPKSIQSAKVPTASFALQYIEYIYTAEYSKHVRVSLAPNSLLDNRRQQRHRKRLFLPAAAVTVLTPSIWMHI